MRPHIDDILLTLVSKFSKNDTSKREILLDPSPMAQDTVCFVESIVVIDRNCIGVAVSSLDLILKPLLCVVRLSLIHI